MTNENAFVTMLTGGHPNSLGRTVEVVEQVFANPAQLEQLYQCYFSPDEVVRLRTSSAMKRICRKHPEWLVPYIDRFIDVIAQINQPSTHWTMAQIFLTLTHQLTPDQRERATAILKHYLENDRDWIVLCETMATLGAWAKADAALSAWLMPHLERLSVDKRKSVAKKARNTQQSLSG